MAAHRCTFRVYYEDTDAGGVMYHARYLAFAERARTEALRSLDLSPAALARTENIQFAVSRAAIEYRRPFRLDDAAEVETVLSDRRAASLGLRQRLFGPHGLHAEVAIVLACVRLPDGRPVRLPSSWAERLDRLGETGTARLDGPP